MNKMIFLLATLLIGINPIYNFKIRTVDGNEIDFRAFAGKKILIVNTATHSRFAGQLSSLEQLYQKYKDSLAVIAIPSNSFGNEPDSADVIESIIRDHYQAHYLIADKMEVNGFGQAPLYKWLTAFSENGHMNSRIENDFQKYLVGADGNLIGYFIPGVDPMDSLVQKAIENRSIPH